ncbi:hypothetical protein YT1_0414 [Rhodococcus ruber]|nr:hypothetical protein YT1_0414 [Rhodococcus ruber]
MRLWKLCLLWMKLWKLWITPARRHFHAAPVEPGIGRVPVLRGRGGMPVLAAYAPAACQY